MTTPDPSREAFEAWARSLPDKPNITREGDGYRYTYADFLWDAWQAAMAHKAADCWQSIETAPKDGTEVWAFNGEQARMRWIEGPGYALWVWVDELPEELTQAPTNPPIGGPSPQPQSRKEAHEEERTIAFHSGAV